VINLRFAAATVCLVLIAGGALAGWLWYNGRPDKLFEGAQEDYHKGQQLRDDPARAKDAYERALTRIDHFLNRADPKDPRLSQAHIMRCKILTPLAPLVEQDENKRDVPPAERKAGSLRAEALREAKKALELDDRNVEALAAMLNDRFANNDFRGAYSYARGLIDNLPGDTKAVELDGFDDYVIGAYYVLALREVENRPDQALSYLDLSLAREKPRPGGGKPVPRWRAALVEVQALQRKADLAGKQPDEARKAEEKLKAQLQQDVVRARAELQEIVPGPEGSPPIPLLASMSVTNTSGLIDVLLFSVRKADSHTMARERADLLLQVCEKLAGTAGAKPYVYQDAGRGSSRLALVNAELPTAHRLTPEEMSGCQARAVAVTDAVLKNGGPTDPADYLELSRAAAAGQPPDRPRALELAKKGLKAAADQHVAANDARLLALQAQAAWLLLLDRKVKEAEEYLSLLGQQKKQAPRVAYMRGLAAVLDGRLEEGVQQLTVAATSDEYKDNLPLLLALQHDYLGQGQLAKALPVLEQLYAIRKREEVKNRDDQIWVELWQPTLTHVGLGILRCELALALRAPRQQDADALERRAMQHYEELKGTFLGVDATAALLEYKLGRLRRLEAKDPDTFQADPLRRDIWHRLNALGAADRNDPRILWTEVNVILSEKEINAAAVAAAVAAPFGAPTDAAVLLGEMGRLRAGFAWQVQNAERRIMQAAAEQKDSLPTQLTWVRWLQLSGRNEEATAKLAELEDRAKGDADRRRLQAARARLLLAGGRSREADEVIQDLRRNNPDVTGDLLYADELLLSGNAKAAKQEIEKALSKQDQSGLYHYWQGQTRQADGDFLAAIASYERSLQFTRFKAQSENAVLACVLGIAAGPPGKPEEANPEKAFKEAKRLRAAHPKDPVILSAFALTARVMDEVYGNHGMEGALADLIRVLAEDRVNAAIGPYFAAKQWVLAGRPDRARQELRSNKDHAPSLALATQLALTDEDWAEAAEDIKAVGKLLPDAIDLPLWRAALLEARGEVSEARETYAKFVEDHPGLNTGYLALARLHERAREYKEALAWVQKWRQKMPDEVNGLHALVRVLAEDGQVPAAVAEADAFTKLQLQKARAAAQAWETRNPITGKDPDAVKVAAERRARAKAEALDSLEFTLNLGTVGALQQAGACAAAEDLLEHRVQPLIERLPEATRKANQLSFKSLRATLCLEQARQLKEGTAERTSLTERAVQDYRDIYKERPGDPTAGNNLAWLLVKEKNEPDQALGLIEEVRKGKYSRQPISPERLPVEILDTLGVVYRAKGMNQESLNLFREAVQKHYAREPRVLLYLGLAQAALRYNTEAYATLRAVINLADQRARASADPQRKEALTKVMAEAKKEQDKIALGGPR
jgi:predicted Zn-dependent protease